MTQRKILIVTNRVPYPLKDGGNLAMQAMIRGYHDAGWQVHLLSMNTTRHFVKEDVLGTVFSYLHGLSVVKVDNTLKPMAILRNFLFGKDPEHVKRFYNEDFKAMLKEVLTIFDPHVVQIESVYLSTYLPLIRKYANAVTVLRMHNVEYQIWQGLARKTKNPLKRFYLDNLASRVRAFERSAWKDYDLLLAITEKDAQVVLRLEDVQNILVAPFGIDTRKIQLSMVQEHWDGYHIGAMDWLPNAAGIRWFLSKAWPKVHKYSPRFQFFFAGRGMPDEFKKMDLPGVHCMSEVPDADAFIADKKILIVPLWSGGGIRVKILEAMAAGKVVITTSKGIKGIDVRPDEHYLRAHTPDDFAKKIKWCLENKQKAEQVAANARELINERYEQGKVIGNVITELERLLERKWH